MELNYSALSSAGPVRANNEDCIAYWKPESLDEQRFRGAIAILADGVGGHGKGEVASQLAVATVLKVFQESQDLSSSQQLLAEAFTRANTAVYDQGMDHHSPLRMATTLAAVVFRGNQICVGNVGDSRVYIIRKGQIKQVSTDHSYVAMQHKLGLINDEEARHSENRSILTRSIGHDAITRVDFEEETIFPGDHILLCSDGLHAYVSDNEICNVVSCNSPARACQELLTLAEKNGTDDNLSVQIILVEEVEEVLYYKGLPVFSNRTREPRSSNNEIRSGEVLDERFLITEMVSRGGMATIYKALDQTNQQTVAIKIPHMQFESDPGFFSRFEREEEIGEKLHHPYILEFIAVEKKSRPYIVTEYLRGYTLAHLLHSVSPLPVRDALKIASRVCEALDYMHSKGVTHRDLKPQNIMICYDGSIRIMDFGIAKGGSGRRITFSGFTPAMGTPDYMAPEQVKGKRGDVRTDIYSLGAILYEMLTGHVPYEGGDNPFIAMNARLTSDPPAPRKMNPELSEQVEEMILHALEREPERRYASALLFKAELENPEQIKLTGRVERLHSVKIWKPHRPWKKILILSISIPLGILLLFILLMHFSPHRHP
ncbi:MAG: bifunctional protein-serine/threonine kinase/phosphatase [Deltaproteobacteria bacterium]|nr:bifunctional protein-serine/threonine kinase/phosphatase [Deltaproteobacteria bacterium]